MSLGKRRNKSGRQHQMPLSNYHRTPKTSGPFLVELRSSWIFKLMQPRNPKNVRMKQPIKRTRRPKPRKILLVAAVASASFDAPEKFLRVDIAGSLVSVDVDMPKPHCISGPGSRTMAARSCNLSFCVRSVLA
jgi:hypothetical protein